MTDIYEFPLYTRFPIAYGSNLGVAGNLDDLIKPAAMINHSPRLSYFAWEVRS